MVLKNCIVRLVRSTNKNVYQYQAYKASIVKLIPSLICESVSIRGIPMNIEVVEMDELRTYIGNKANQYWVAYALCSKTKKILDFIVGKRSKHTLKMVVNTLLMASVKIIKTDKLNVYQSLIPSKQHIAKAYNINHIERNNLNLRTHLKRLSRRTICFSRSKIMLEACVKIYFWRY